MASIDDLTGIREDKRKEAVGVLESLLTFRYKNGILSPIITGYNWYNTLAKSDRVITLSHIHETETYKQDMVNDLEELGYSPKFTLAHIRSKAGAFLWDPEFRIRDDLGDVFPGLGIRDLRTNFYLNLEKYKKQFLSAYSQFKDCKGKLVAEDQGWELNIPFNNRTELISLINLFLIRSAKFIFDEKNTKINEEEVHRSWRDAYETPVLLLGEMALRYKNELPYFDQVTKLSLIEGSNEISFVIHKNIKRLKKLKQYGDLMYLGFGEEVCLANKKFIDNLDEYRP
ncbi:hypothetical protein HY498_01680 [Candidatus Woesearchaeota archaeon]|nr:hypothetical protein [Candidatus Woesearchaeota archaeon]